MEGRAMKLSKGSFSWKFEVTPLSEQDETYRAKIAIGRKEFSFEAHLDRWYRIAEISAAEGVYLRYSPTKVQRRYIYDELFDKLKEEISKV
jgi:hypothetical protein